MKKNLFIVFILILLFPLKVILFANETLDKSWFELYNQRVEDICEKYNPEKKIFKTEWYKETNTEINNNIKEKTKEYSERIEYLKLKFDVITDEEKKELKELEEKKDNKADWYNAFSDAKKLYENNMNSIYKCAVLNAQLSTLNLLKEDIVKISENPELSKEIEPELDKKIKKIEISKNTLQCKPISNNNDWIQKLNILQQTTFELCRYHSYLEYLREYNSDYENLTVSSEQTDYNSMYLVNLEQYRKEQIDNEINHIYKVYPLAFNAYKQYEDNLSTHILLWLIKDDYKVLRNNLHKVLNPINQVVYKISNAMKE